MAVMALIGEEQRMASISGVSLRAWVTAVSITAEALSEVALLSQIGVIP